MGVELLQQTLVSQFLSQIALSQFEQGNIARSELKNAAESLKKISAAYLKRNPLKFSSEDAAAYALYYGCINFSKVSFLLDILPPGIKNKNISVLDFGSGPGTASIAVRSWSSQDLDVHCIEKSQPMSEVCDKLVSSYSKNFDLITNLKMSTNLASVASKFDLVIAANSLNEMQYGQREKVAEHLSSFLNETGSLIILEPAQQVHTRELMMLRDHIRVSAPELQILFPCIRQDSCPMLTNSVTDWCHSEMRWEIPRLVRMLDEATGFNKHRTKWSGYVFSKINLPSSGYRVVSIPKKTKRGISATLCGGNFYGRATLKDPKINWMAVCKDDAVVLES